MGEPLADDIPWYVILLAGVGIGVFLMWFAASNKLGLRRSLNIPAPEPCASGTCRTIATNEEKCEWIDYRGNKRYYIMSREVKE